MTERIPREPLLEVEKVLPILDKIVIFGGFDESQLYEIFRRLKLVHFQAGETVFCAGDSASYIYIIETGRVDLFYQVGDKQVLKAELNPGACIGDMTVIGIQPHTATAVAVEKSDLLVLSGEAMDELYHKDLDLFARLILNIAREACRRLHKTNQQLVQCLVHYPDAVIDGIEGY